MEVIKRDGKTVDFDREKISAAINKANTEVKPKERASKEDINEIIDYVESLDKKRILVEDIQDIIEEKLMELDKYSLAKKYITYRYTRALIRKANTTDQSIKELIDGESDYWNNENSNKNAKVVTTQRDYLAGITSTDITRRFLLPKDVVEAHDAGIIHFHDADYFAQNALTNCELINLEDMLQNGTIMNGVMIENIHFSGHGMDTGELVLLNPDGTHKLVTKEAIALAMSTASDTIRLVVFNACFSESQAESVVEYVDSAIGMSTSIGDKAACVFAAQLYSSIGFGLSLQSAFDQAIAQLMLEGIPENNTPKLYTKDGVISDQIILVQSNGV